MMSPREASVGAGDYPGFGAEHLHELRLFVPLNEAVSRGKVLLVNQIPCLFVDLLAHVRADDVVGEGQTSAHDDQQEDHGGHLFGGTKPVTRVVQRLTQDATRRRCCIQLAHRRIEKENDERNAHRLRERRTESKHDQRRRRPTRLRRDLEQTGKVIERGAPSLARRDRRLSGVLVVA